MKLLSLFVLLCCGTILLQAQETEWMHHAGESRHSFHVSGSNRLLYFQQEYTSTGDFLLHLTSQHADKRIAWKKTFLPDTIGRNDIYGHQIVSGRNGQFYLLLIHTDKLTLRFSPTVLVDTKVDLGAVIIRFDSSGNALQQFEVGLTSNASSMVVNNGQLLVEEGYYKERLYLRTYAFDSIYWDGSWKPIPKRNLVWLRLEEDLANPSMLSILPQVFTVGKWTIDQYTGDAYLAVLLDQPLTYAIGKTVRHLAILRMSVNGVIRDHLEYNSSFQSNPLFQASYAIKGLHAEKGIITLSTLYKDTLDVGGTLILDSSRQETSLALLQLDFTTKKTLWHHTSRDITPNLISDFHVYGGAFDVKNRSVYLLMTTYLYWFSSGSPPKQEYCLFANKMVPNAGISNPTLTGHFLKIDSLGNVLWFFSDTLNNSKGLGTHYMNIQVGPDDGIYTDGTYSIQTYLFEDSLVAPPTTFPSFANLFVAKIRDFSIKRGDVYGGPYCAGDTIRIPFTSKGNFAASNEFIAELSDENGNFGSNLRELGRISGRDSGTIKGPVPRFNVISGGAYRIRVRATEPAVISNYKLDTLRLLIYSKDSADAGMDDTICFSETVQLGTTGGTRWSWSPGTTLNDSTLRQPLASPLVTTTYRVIISDSSGCGDTDTDEVTIFVKPLLKPFFSVADTFCYGQMLLASDTGITDKRSYEWFLDNTLQSTTDTLQFSTNTLVAGLHTITCKMTDECPVTAREWEQTFYLRQKLDVSLSLDSPCFQSGALLTATASGGKQTAYRYYWELNGAALAHSLPQFNYEGDSNVLVRVGLTDACQPDTVWKELLVQVIPKGVFSLVSAPSCLPQAAVLKVQTDTGIKVFWQTGDGTEAEIDSEAVHHFLQPGHFTGKLILENRLGCRSTYSLPEITVPVPPKAGFTYTPEVLRLFGEPLQLTSDTAGNISYDWFFNGEKIGSGPEYTYTLPDSGWFDLKLKIKNRFGCEDSIRQRVYVFDKFTYFIPNSFSPEGNNLNEMFGPVATGIMDVNIRIYDRWGSLVWEGRNIHWNGSDGKGNPLPEGNYLYMISLQATTGKREHAKGTVYLKR